MLACVDCSPNASLLFFFSLQQTNQQECSWYLLAASKALTTLTQVTLTWVPRTICLGFLFLHEFLFSSDWAHWVLDHMMCFQPVGLFSPAVFSQCLIPVRSINGYGRTVREVWQNAGGREAGVGLGDKLYWTSIHSCIRDQDKFWP